MARQPKSATNLQVFLGSKPQPDVFMQNAGLGCCDVTPFNYDNWVSEFVLTTPSLT